MSAWVAPHVEATGSAAAKPSRARAGLVTVAGIVSGLLVAGALVCALAIQVFGYRVIQVSSGSMEPLLRPGDLFVTRPVDIADVEIGDVVLVEQGRDTTIPVAHRVHGVINLRTTILDADTGEKTTQLTRTLQTKGDANERPDAQLVDANSLRGVLWFQLGGLARFLGPLSPQQVFLLAAFAIAAAWGLYEVVRYIRRRDGRGVTS
jgi:signal peptidase